MAADDPSNHVETDGGELDNSAAPRLSANYYSFIDLDRRIEERRPQNPEEAAGYQVPDIFVRIQNEVIETGGAMDLEELAEDLGVDLVEFEIDESDVRSDSYEVVLRKDNYIVKYVYNYRLYTQRANHEVKCVIPINDGDNKNPLHRDFADLSPVDYLFFERFVPISLLGELRKVQIYREKRFRKADILTSENTFRSASWELGLEDSIENNQIISRSKTDETACIIVTGALPNFGNDSNRDQKSTQLKVTIYDNRNPDRLEPVRIYEQNFQNHPKSLRVQRMANRWLK